MKKKLLFVCKHNVFRSRIAEEIFNKCGNKEYEAESAGVIGWDKDSLLRDKTHILQKQIAKQFGIDLKYKSRSLDSSILKNIDLVVIVADNVPPEIFNDESFNGEVIVWKVKDVEIGNLEQSILRVIKLIFQKIEDFTERIKRLL